MHASLIAGHMSEYKTLYRIRLHFFWPRMRADIKENIQQCSNCTLTCRWRRRGQELTISWPISSPSAILHVDLWSPGHMTNHNSYIVLMSRICDMNQFVVVIPVPDETSTTLASHFMQHVLMKFGMCHLVVIDDDTMLRKSLMLCARL